MKKNTSQQNETSSGFFKEDLADIPTKFSIEKNEHFFKFNVNYDKEEHLVDDDRSETGFCATSSSTDDY